MLAHGWYSLLMPWAAAWWDAQRTWPCTAPDTAWWRLVAAGALFWAWMLPYTAALQGWRQGLLEDGRP